MTILERVLGYVRLAGRGKGSHHIFQNRVGDKLTVPTVRGRFAKRTYVKKIALLLEEAGHGPKD